VVKGEHDMLNHQKIKLFNGRIYSASIQKPITASIEKIDSGMRLSLIDQADDIAERKKVEETHSYLMAHLDASPDFVSFIDARDSKILYINRAGRAMTGVGKDEDVTQLKITDVHPDWANQMLEEVILPIATRADNWQGESAILHREGHEIPVSLILSALKSPSGEVEVFSTTSRDITERKRAEDELRTSALKHQLLFESSHYAMMMLAPPSWKFTGANQATLQLFGASSVDEFTALGLWDISPERQPDGSLSSENAQEMIEIAMRDGSHFFEWEHQRLDGKPFTADVLMTRLEVGSELFLQATVLDITGRKQAEAELRIAATAFEAQEGMLVTDANNVILRVNHAFTEITGYTAEEAVGQTPSLLKSGRHDAVFYAAMWDILNNNSAWQGEIWNRRKNGEIYPEYLTITAVKDHNGSVTNYVTTFNDITKSKAAVDDIKHLAFYDPLTRLPNRRLLLDRLKQALASGARSGRTGALLFIDLDNFKTLNDTLGHNVGDLLLQQVAQRLESCVREEDTVARLGGDEFVVMLEYLSKNFLEAAAQTKAVGNKMLFTLSQPYLLAGHEYLSTTSIGATLFSDREQSQEELLKQADIAMYQAKKAGRNTLRFFDPQMQDTINARADLESELRKALEKQQFHLYYQIQVDDSHRPLGAEALIRWIHPERGLVSPLQFIPLAEETGLILPIGQWVMDTACAQLKIWQQNALTRDLVLAVNVSAKQFHQPNFVVQVQSALQRNAINPKLLKLELTESLLLNDIEDIIKKMNELNEIGCQLSLDDFGTGYSSLQYLKRLPLDQLKIDQSFVRDLASDNSDKAIVRTIISMAHSLKLDVIAEGVETEEQRQFLLKKGCTHYQGYLFGKPMPIDQFEALLKRSQSILMMWHQGCEEDSLSEKPNEQDKMQTTGGRNNSRLYQAESSLTLF
jgi:diguanylate cyclase (GGDEF)-like protein/PAS domain S-box-containing protein